MLRVRNIDHEALELWYRYALTRAFALAAFAFLSASASDISICKALDEEYKVDKDVGRVLIKSKVAPGISHAGRVSDQAGCVCMHVKIACLCRAEKV